MMSYGNILLVILLGRSLTVRCQKATTVDPLFSRPLEEIWESPNLRLKLQQALIACHSEEESAPAKQVTPCQTVFFLEHVVKIVEDFSNTKNRVEKGELQNADFVLPAVEKKVDLSFQEFFITNAVGEKAVVLSGLDPQFPGFIKGLELCAQKSGRVAESTLYEAVDMLSEKCKGDIQAFVVQKYFVNDYLSRLGNKDFLSSFEAFLAPADEGGLVNPHVCPFAQHMEVEVISGSITATIFPSVAGFVLEPEFEFKPESSLAVNDLARPTFKEINFGSLELGTSTQVGAGEALYAPAGQPVGWSAGPGAVVVRRCALGAPELARARAALQAAALVDLGAREMLQALIKPGVDFSLERTPESLPWSQFLKWPRAPRPGGAEGEGGGAADGGGGGGGGRSRRERKKFADWQSDKTWAWAVLRLTLPAPLPPAVAPGRRDAVVTFASAHTKAANDASAVGYNVTWEAVGAPGEGEGGEGEGAFGGHRLFSEAELAPRPSHAFGYGVPGKLLTARVEGLRPDTAYVFRAQVVHNDAPGPASPASPAARTRPVRPPGAPRGVAARAAEGGAAAAAATRLGACWFPPEDDGGEPITGYHLMKLHTDEHTHDDWEFLGTFFPNFDPNMGGLCHTVPHLLPGTAYSFKVAARTAAGDGLWSAPSPPARTPLPQLEVDPKGKVTGGTGHVYGRGWDPITHTSFKKDMFEAPLHLETHSSDKKTSYDQHGPVVTLHDHEARLEVRRGGGGPAVAVAAWTCAWSPQAFSVTAEAVRADPFLADRPLRNKAVLRKRLALVGRGGGVPLVTKALRAQAAGALGVIVVDDGRCRAFDQRCVRGADLAARGELWARGDRPGPWRGVRVPVVLVLAGDAEAHLFLPPLLPPGEEEGGEGGAPRLPAEEGGGAAAREEL